MHISPHPADNPKKAEFWRELGKDLLALIWPCACTVCGAPDRELCASCRTHLREAEGECHEEVLPQGVRAFTAGPYAGPRRALLVSFKHEGKYGFGRVLGAQLTGPLRAAISVSARGSPLVVTAPSRASRVRERGYRHVDVLVRRALRGSYGVRATFIPRALRALPGRVGQVGLDAHDRAVNASRLAVSPGIRKKLRGRQVIVVDDVMTTGATLAAATRVLTSAGAEVIAVVALCSAVRRDTRFVSAT